MKNETKGRRTSIGNVARILSCNSMAKVVKAEYHYKALTPMEVTPIDTTTMLKSIESLAKNIVFACCVDWRFENVSKTSKEELKVRRKRNKNRRKKERRSKRKAKNRK